MTLKCTQCGKPFPVGQEWCNWCESAPPGNFGGADKPIDHRLDGQAATQPEQAAGEVPEENGIVVTVFGSLFMFLLKGFCILSGLVLIAGGVLLSLCGTMGGSGGWIGVLLGILPIAIGGYFVVLASGKSRPGPNETPREVETTIAENRQSEEQ